MTHIAANIAHINQQLASTTARLVAVTKTKPVADLMAAYEAGCTTFGENKVQEMLAKWEVLPKDIAWHLIGHLQSNKVKYIAPFVEMIHSVDSLRLLQEIDKQAAKNERVIDCLLQIFIAQEETKFGLLPEEAQAILCSEELQQLHHIRLVGLMGMASNTDNLAQVRQEFKDLKSLFDTFALQFSNLPNVVWKELSMGMSGDYLLAAQEGSTLVRVGSAIFGNRL